MPVAHEADLLQGLEVAVHRGEVGAREAALQPIGDLLRGDRGVGGVERFEHEAPGRRDPQAPRPQRAHGRVEIGRVDGGACVR